MLLSDYMTTVIAFIYQDGEMKLSVPLSNVPNLDHYPVKIGLRCITGSSSTDVYRYDYSQLSIANIASRDFIEKIDQVNQAYSGFQPVIETLKTKRQTAGQVTYAIGSGLQSYAKTGVHILALSTETSHPVQTCQTWLDSHSNFSTQLHTRCPGASSQIPEFISLTAPTITIDGITYYFIEEGSNTTGMICGYMSDGTFLSPSSHVQYNGRNLFR